MNKSLLSSFSKSTPSRFPQGNVEMKVCCTTPSPVASIDDFTIVDEKSTPPKILSGTSFSTIGATRSSVKTNNGLPPAICTTVIVSHKYRFINSSNAANRSVTVSTLLTSLGGIATSAISFSSFASAVRLRSVTVFPSSGGDVDLAWTALGQHETDEVKDHTIPGGITVTSPALFRPPKDALVSKWQNSSTPSAQLFTISSSMGSIVDVHVEYRLSNAFGNVTATVVGASAGTVSYTPLDTGGTYLPIGVPISLF